MKPVVAISLLAALFAGCSDSSSDNVGDPGDSAGTTFNDAGSSGGGGLNAPLSGTIIYYENKADLDSGTVSDLFPQVPASPGILTASSDGKTSLETIDGCVEHSINPSRYEADCVVVRDNASGQEIARVVTDGSIYRTRLSLDGELIAMDVGYTGGPSFPGSTFGYYAQLMIARASDGSLLTRERDREQRRNVGDFRWTPEGSLMYVISDGRSSAKNQIRLIENPLLDPPESDEIIVDLDEFGLEGGLNAGGVGYFDVSRDGTTLAFDWNAVQDASDGTHVLYTMNIASRDIRPLAFSRLFSKVRFPKFSPDGEWVIANVGRVPSTVSGVPPLRSATVALRLANAPHAIVVDGRLETDGVQFIKTACEQDCDDEAGGFDYLSGKVFSAWVE